MKKAILTVLLFVAMAGSGNAGWQSDIATNQNMATNYISELQVNRNAKRPQLIEGAGWQSQRSLGEINSAMSRAEQLARSGRPDLIQIPVFKYGAEKDSRDGDRR
ncbi:MAG: hypothetical protein JZU65_07225 [Chlorobium sp.]|nr:hypothetical protein [Chlorobium sp.]